MKQVEFENNSGAMVISDPCYELGTWCMGEAKVKTGTWVGIPIFLGNRVARLMVYHKETIENNPSEFEELKYLCENELNFRFGVDSGQLGFFDKATYRDDNSVKDLEAVDFGADYDEKSGDFWYRAVSHQTLEIVEETYKNFGGIPTGCVSSSGWGDGVYSVYGLAMDDEYYGFLAEFIDSDGDIEEVTNEYGTSYLEIQEEADSEDEE